MTIDSPSMPDEIGIEIEAIGAVRQVLVALQPEQRARVISYLAAVYGVAPLSALPALPEVGAGGGGAPRSGEDPRRVFAAKKPASDIERVLVLAYGLAQKGELRFDSSQLAEGRLLAAAAPFNVIEAAKSAVKKGYFAAAGEGKRQLTVLGEEVAEALPDRTAVTELLHESGKRISKTKRK